MRVNINMHSSLSTQVSKNIYQYKNYLLLLFLAVLILLFIQFIYNKNTNNTNNTNNIEGFAATPTPTQNQITSPTIPAKFLKKIYFKDNFQKDKIKKIYEAKMDDMRYVSFWEKDEENDYFPLGQVAITTNSPATEADLDQEYQKGLGLLVKGASFPLDYEKIWDNKKDGSKPPLSIWKVIPPKDYYAMGDMVVAGFKKPLLSQVRCLPKQVLINTKKINEAIWKNPLPREKTKDGREISPPNAFSIWNIGNYGFFLGKDSYDRPEARTDKIFNISSTILENQELDPSDSKKILKVTLKV